MGKAVSFTQFKGMNRLADISNMPKEYLFDIYNGFLSHSNSIKKRFGYSKYYDEQVDSGASIKKIYEAIWDDGTSDFFVCTATKIFKYNSGGPSWSSLKTGLTSGNNYSIAQYEDELIIANGLDTPQKYAKSGGTVGNLAGTPPTFGKVIILQNRAFGINAADPYSIKYSALGDIEDYTTAGAAGAGNLDVQAYVDSGDSIQDIQAFSKSYLAIFMTNHIFVYSIGTDATAFALYQIINRVGSNGQKASIQFGNDIYFMDTDSAKSLRVAFQTEELNLNDFTKGIFGDYYREKLDGVSTDRLLMSKYNRKSWILMHVPISSSGEIWVWDYALKAWSGRWAISDAVNDMIELKNGDLLFASEGYVYKFNEDDLTDDGDTVDFILQSPFYYGRNPGRNERHAYMEVLAETSTTDTEIEYSGFYGFGDTASTYEVIDLEASASYWDVAQWDTDTWDASGENFYRVPILGRGKMYRSTFRNNQSAKGLEIKFWSMIPVNQGMN